MISTGKGDILGAKKTTILSDGKKTTVQFREEQTTTFEEVTGTTTIVDQKDSSLEISQNGLKGSNLLLSFSKPLRFTPSSNEVSASSSVDCKNCEKKTVTGGSSYSYILPTTSMSFESANEFCVRDDVLVWT